MGISFFEVEKGLGERFFQTFPGESDIGRSCEYLMEKNNDHIYKYCFQLFVPSLLTNEPTLNYLRWI